MDLRPLVTREEILTGVDLWNELHPTIAISRRLATQKLYTPSPGVAVRVWGGFDGDDLVGFVVAKYLTEPVPGYEDGSQGWISLLAADGTHSDARTLRNELVETAVNVIRDQGIDDIRFGKDVQKFVAGVPKPLNDHYGPPLESSGLTEGGVVADLYQDISTPAAADMVEAYLPTENDVRVDRVRTPAEEDQLHGFLEREFPGRWASQAATDCRLPGSTRDYWLLWEDSEPVAFARTGTATSPVLSSCTNWTAVFGERYCGLGPIGVAEDARGNARGLTLIANVMATFSGEGYHHMTIDGVVPRLYDYYAKLGFQPWLKFVEYDTED
ncbi:GNAT family N-acetyltransferase [Halorussus salinisoli]|uniref:GNAT family N-acetyltransferase n=1 Tax=Halorussus salinisoli TaxID=2558242 RepID=UPI0010C1A677|nr:GNAT family N-acetyltransferase [Halorussus salinisoli]